MDSRQMKLRIPANRYRCHYVRVRVCIHRYPNGSLAIFHGPRKLAEYDPQGKLREANIRRSPPVLKTSPFGEQKKRTFLFVDNSIF